MYPFPKVFSTLLSNNLPFSSSLKLSSANFLSSEESKFFVWERVNRTMPHFDAFKIYSCGKHLRKGKNACNKQILILLQCFLSYMVLFFHFKSTENVFCNLFQFGPV